MSPRFTKWRPVAVALITVFALILGLAGQASAAAPPTAATYYDSEGYSRSGITQVVIHTAEAPERNGMARGVCSYLANLGGASIHYCVDNAEVVASAPESRGAWAAGCGACYPAIHSIQIELAGYAGQSRTDWDDAYSQAELDVLARLVADITNRYRIPVRHLSDNELRQNLGGILGHDQVSRVFAGDHWDPGPNFPWTKFIHLVAYYAGGAAPAPSDPVTPPNPTPSPVPCSTTSGTGYVQATLKLFGFYGAPIDCDYGPATRFGVALYQIRMGLPVDGVWGPQTQAANDRFWAALGSVPQAPAPASPPMPTLTQGASGSAVKTLQAKLASKGYWVAADGVFGPKTRAFVIDWQRRNGLVADGVVGPRTWATL